MKKMIKEEFLHTISRKRFYLPVCPLLFGPLISLLCTQDEYRNDLVFLLDSMNYLQVVFAPILGCLLLISVYRRKYTQTSIRLAEEHGLGRGAAVFARWLSGALILCACYLLVAVIIPVTGLIFDVGMSRVQLGMLVWKLVTNCAATVATYTIALFFLYLFAFPLLPVLLYLLLATVAPLILLEGGFSFSWLHHTLGFIVPMMNAELLYTALVLSNPQVLRILLFLPHAAVPLLLSMLIFRLKKKKP